MPKHTTRDRCWNYALKVTHRNGESITSEQLASMADAAERSARDVLKTMAEDGHLKQRKQGREVSYVADSEMAAEESYVAIETSG